MSFNGKVTFNKAGRICIRMETEVNLTLDLIQEQFFFITLVIHVKIKLYGLLSESLERSGLLARWSRTHTFG